MSKTRLLACIESTINSALRRLSKLEGHDKESLKGEFREWMDAIDSDDKDYDVLFINKIGLESLN